MTDKLLFKGNLTSILRHGSSCGYGSGFGYGSYFTPVFGYGDIFGAGNGSGCGYEHTVKIDFTKNFNDYFLNAGAMVHPDVSK